MVTASKGHLISDDGSKYLLSEPVPGDDLSSGRYMVRCGILEKTGEDTYEVELLSIEKAVCTDIMKGSEAEPGHYGSDPDNVENVWISGRYLNMLNCLETIPQSGTVHEINLVYEDLRSHDDSLFFTLCHDAHGETPGTTPGGYVQQHYYSSYDIWPFLPEGYDESVITLDWVWDGRHSVSQKIKIKRKQ